MWSLLFQLIIGVLMALSAEACWAASLESIYWQLAQDISTNGKTLLVQKTLAMQNTGNVYVQSSGRYGPIGSSIANIYIEIDGQHVSSDAVTDWSKSTNPQQHSFEVIGSKLLQAGNHTIRLWAEPKQAQFYIGAGANLSVMVNPATEVKETTLGIDTGEIDFSTAGLKVGTPLPRNYLLSVKMSYLGTPIVGIGSTRAYAYPANRQGDALAFIGCNTTVEHNEFANYSVTDLYSGAEPQTILSNHMLCSEPSLGVNQLSLIFSELPWCEEYELGGCDHSDNNPVSYHVGATSKIVGLSGGMRVVGSAPTSVAVNNRTDYILVGSSRGLSPSVGTNVTISSATISIPQDHNGVVLFTAKSRVQGSQNDGGGTIWLWIEIDGVRVGSTGVQQLRGADSISQRTIVASYMSAGNRRLVPGVHTVSVVGRADGDFQSLSMVKDLPLIWFD